MTLCFRTQIPTLVIQQLDIGNLYNGGAKAIDIVKQYPGRFQSMHVKDEITATEGNEKYESTVLGKGIVNVKEVIDLGTEIRWNDTFYYRTGIVSRENSYRLHERGSGGNEEMGIQIISMKFVCCANA